MPVRPGDRLEHRVAIGHVERQRKNGIAVSADEIVEGLQVASGRRDSVTALERSFRPDAAEPARSSGDEPYLGLRISLTPGPRRPIEAGQISPAEQHVKKYGSYSVICW